MKQLAPIIVKPEYYELIEKTLNKFWDEVFYSPIMEIFKREANIIVNVKSPIADALNSGRIQYVNGSFSGKFNSTLVKEFNKIGAVFDKRTGLYNINISRLPISIQSGIAIAQAKFERLNQSVLDYVDGINNEFIDSKLEQLPLFSKYMDVVDDLDDAFQKSIRKIAIKPDVSPRIARNLADIYSTNMELFIKNWTEENILELREKVYRNTFEGFRAEKLVEIIQKNNMVSENKAKFLARQETSLLTSKYRQERYTAIGSRSYKWRIRGFNTRPDHRQLNNTVFLWSTPPITNTKTGERNHPGEDFNCFCTAIAQVDF